MTTGVSKQGQGIFHFFLRQLLNAFPHNLSGNVKIFCTLWPDNTTMLFSTMKHRHGTETSVCALAKRKNDAGEIKRYVRI